MKSRRGRKRIDGEARSVRLYLDVTPTVKRLLLAISQVLGESITEVISRWTATTARELGIDEKARGDESPPETDREVLIGFLRCLILTGDHDGYSLAEIAQIIGMRSDREVVDFVERVKKSREDKNGEEEESGSTQERE